MLTLVLSILGAPLLQQNKVTALRIGADVAVSKAYSLSEAILADPDQRSLDRYTSSFRAIHTPGVLANPADSRPLNDTTQRAVAALRADPRRPHQEFTTVAGTRHLFYSVADRAGGVLTIDLNLEAERALIGRFFGQSYLSTAAVAYTLIGLLMFATFALRHYLRTLAALPTDERRDTINKGLNSAHGSRRNLLPWLLVLCAFVFALDITNLLDSAVGIGYILAVLLSLYSSRGWHVTATASIGAVLLVMGPLISPYDAAWWTALESHAVSVFAILMTGFFGSANMRKTQAEAIAIAEAARSRNETAELRSALERAEAAEAANRRMVERVRTANEAAGISVWEWNLKRDVIYIDEGSPMIARCGGVTESPNGSAYATAYVHPDNRDEWMKTFTGALSGARGDVFSFRYRTIDGAQSLQLHARVLRNAQDCRRAFSASTGT